MDLGGVLGMFKRVLCLAARTGLVELVCRWLIGEMEFRLFYKMPAVQINPLSSHVRLPGINGTGKVKVHMQHLVRRVLWRGDRCLFPTMGVESERMCRMRNILDRR
jgi:hypothetical protein